LANGRVEAASGAKQQGPGTNDRVIDAAGITEKCERPVGRVAAAVGVAKKRTGASGCIFSGGVGKRVPAPRAVQKAPSVRLKREYTPTAVLYWPALVFRLLRDR